MSPAACWQLLLLNDSVFLILYLGLNKENVCPMCVCVCVCDVIKMAKWRPRGRWRRQLFRGDSRESCVFSADGRSCTRTRHTERYSSPSATGAAFVVGPTPIPSRPAFLLPRWTSTRPHHPTTTPPEVPRAGSRTGPPLQSLVATVAG